MASAPLTHSQIWTALDRLAARAKLSPSGLAKRSGLDPTTFNKSKRITPDGRARWPSTESIAKALAATSVRCFNRKRRSPTLPPWYRFAFLVRSIRPEQGYFGQSARPIRSTTS